MAKQQIAEQTESQWADHFAAQFRQAVARADDLKLPIYSASGKTRLEPVSTFLGECHRDAQALLFRACAAAARGDSTMAAELLVSFTNEVATEYGVTTAEAAKLIADPDDDADTYRAPVELTREQCAAMDETAGLCGVPA